MRLRDLLEEIGRKYDRSLGYRSEAQQLLKGAGAQMQEWLPAGYVSTGGGGRGNRATVPWIAVFDPDETETPQQGMYLVYLFANGRESVYLSLNHGVLDLVKRLGRREARRRLAGEAQAIRDTLDSELLAGLDTTIDLRSSSSLPKDYEAANVVARSYKIPLPGDSELVDDLQRFVRLYQIAREAREEVRRTMPGRIVTTQDRRPRVQRDAEFKPKNDEDYTQTIEGRTIQKSRKHETLITEYAEWLKARGFQRANNVHPRDLVADKGEEHWLIEAKILYAGDAVSATRDALGQLLWYRRYHENSPNSVQMVALFNESIGPECVEFLEEIGIASVWKSGLIWEGSDTAVRGGLCGG